MSWQPDREKLLSVVGILKRSVLASNEERDSANQALEEAAQHPEFIQYLTHVFSQ